VINRWSMTDMTVFSLPQRTSRATGESDARLDAREARDTVGRRACAFVFIENLPHLVEVYGQDFASAASRELHRRLCAHFVVSPSSHLARLRDDCFLIWSNKAFDCSEFDGRAPGEPPHFSKRSSGAIEMLLTVAGAEPVCVGNASALLQLHADWIDVCSPEKLGNSEIELMLWSAQPYPDSRELRADGWRQLYRADMDVASRVNEALLADALSFTWRPVAHPGDLASVLYFSGRVRLASGISKTTSLVPEVFMPCLRRLGLTRAFDRAVIRQAVAALRSRPSIHIGVSVSAQSIRLDHWWASLLVILDREPALAPRLVVEIVDCAAMTDLETARDFCTQLQLRGCRIAIRDLGGGADNLAAVQVCGPDIVILDATFLRRARDSDFGRNCLRGMLAMCAGFAQYVVVNGIERKADADIAERAGARWLQSHDLRGAERQVMSVASAHSNAGSYAEAAP